MKERGKTPGEYAEGRSWSTGELAELRRLAPFGVDAIAVKLGRSVRSVRRQAEKQRVSLRRDGERRGRVLGQITAANRVVALRTLREDVLEGRVDVARMERRIRLIARGAPMCPACGKRPQEVEQTGLCQDCHLRELAWAHALESSTADAQREVDRERQRKHRRKETP